MAARVPDSLNIPRFPSTGSRAEKFDLLVEGASGCRQCARMNGNAVLGGGNGPLDARVMFIAEAPGRLGAARTGVPLSGDQSGRNFVRLLQAASLRREDVFITNAVLCNPLDGRGRNASPTRLEVRNCVHFLRQTIDVVGPSIVVTLGAAALSALQLIAPHDAVLRRDVGQVLPWADRLLVPLYHPSPRAQLHRTYVEQEEDFIRLGEIIRAETVARLAVTVSPGRRV